MPAGDSRFPSHSEPGEDGGPGYEMGLVWLDRPLAPGETMQLAFEIGACGYGVQPELSSDIDAVVNGGRIDISAEVKDSEGALDRLLCVTDPCTADAGAIKEIGRTEGTGEFVPLDGTFPLPPIWNVGEVHSVEMWVENDAGLKSASTTVNILVVENEDGSDVMVPATPVQVVFGEGDDAQVVDTFEQAVIPIPDGPADVPEGKKFAGWQDPEGNPWNPGSEWTVPSGAEGGGLRTMHPAPCPLRRFRRRAAMHKWRVLREIPGNPPLVHCRGMVAGRMPASRCRRWLQRIPGLSLRFARLPQKREGVKAENPPGARLRCF